VAETANGLGGPPARSGLGTSATGGTSGGAARGMGRGLAAILSTSSRAETGLREIPTELIRPNPNQPRREFDDEALLALAESLKAGGIIQPVVVPPVDGGG
jgi:ParB family chromosome partitioning protein